FLAATPGCKSVAGTQNTFDCFQAANSSAIYQNCRGLDGHSDAIPPDLPTCPWARGQFATIPFISKV
ncbi:hypothetical protein ARMGADRAFT_926199, partial [Armillaria gallica]